MKKFYEFSINKSIETEEPVIEKNEKGEEIKVLKKITKEVPQKYFIRKINRSLQDSCRLFHGAQHALAIQKGLMPAILLQKRHIDDADIFSEKEKEFLLKLRNDTIEKQEKFETLSSIKDEDKTEEQKKELQKIISDLVDINSEMTKINEKKNAAYRSTAEGYAEEKAITWWILVLAYYINDKGEEKEFFGEGEFDKKIAKFDAIDEDGSELDKKALRYLTSLISYYILNNEATAKDLDTYLKILEKQEEVNKE